MTVYFNFTPSKEGFFAYYKFYLVIKVCANHLLKSNIPCNDLPHILFASTTLLQMIAPLT